MRQAPGEYQKQLFQIRLESQRGNILIAILDELKRVLTEEEAKAIINLNLDLTTIIDKDSKGFYVLNNQEPSISKRPFKGVKLLEKPLLLKECG